MDCKQENPGGKHSAIFCWADQGFLWNPYQVVTTVHVFVALKITQQEY